MCYSTTDLKNWNYERVIMKADKASIPWAKTGTDAWAGQMAKYNDKYYFYHCTWDSTSSGKQSIGVAVSDSPTGPFEDIGEPLVKGTVTTGQTSDWNDIDPTVWIEEDENGVEHRYLSWGNGKVFICELNEDMTSIKDINGDGEITFGTQASGKTSEDVDILEQTVTSLTFTEAPWLYRRKDANGDPYGQYYLFYAWGWREEMAYATSDDLFNGTWEFGGKLMPPAATSNTNHSAVFDFNGKTYFVYHNGMLPGGSGFRRNAAIAELKFNDDGSIDAIPESAIGITGDTPYTISASNGIQISHANFTNSSADSDYPYTTVEVGTYVNPEDADAQWAIVDGKSVPENGNADAYVSIQSENKPGLYLTVNEGDTVTLAQQAKYSVVSGHIVADADIAKAQTFRTVKGLNGDEDGVSFESVAKPGYYITISGGSTVITDGSNAAAATFYLNQEESGDSNVGTGTDTSIKSMSIDGTAVNADIDTYSATVPFETTVAKAQFALTDEDAYAIVNGKKTVSSDTIYITLASKTTETTVTVYASNGTTKKNYKITITKANPTNMAAVSNEGLVKTFAFNDATDGATAVTKAMVPTAVSNPSYEYVEGKNGKAIHMNGSYGLKLMDGAGIGNTYTISYWMKPDTIKSAVDPTLAAGTFSPEYWLNLTHDKTRAVWSKSNNNYVEILGKTSYQANVWQHVALVVTDATAKLYLNGELICEGNIAADILSQDGAAIYFGVNAWDAYYEGALDEVAVFKRALSEAEVQSIAYEGTFVSTLKIPSADSNVNTNTNTNTNTDKNQNTTVAKKSVKKVVIRQVGKKKNLKKLTVKKKKTKKIKLKAVVTVTGGASKKVTWKSSKKKIASVSKKGVVTIKKKGKVKITATSKANKKKKCTITIVIK